MIEVDTLVLCPACRCMGHHPFSTRRFEARTIPGPAGPIAIPQLSDPPEGTPVVDRTCVFCGHHWTRMA